MLIDRENPQHSSDSPFGGLESIFICWVAGFYAVVVIKRGGSPLGAIIGGVITAVLAAAILGVLSQPKPKAAIMRWLRPVHSLLGIRSETTQTKHGVRVSWQDKGDRSKPTDPISVLWVEGLQVTNNTDAVVVVYSTGHWRIEGEEVEVEESQGRGEFRVGAYDVGPKPVIEELRFEMSSRERRRLNLSFSQIKKSHRYIRVTDRLSGQVFDTITIDDGSHWTRRFQQLYRGGTSD